MKTEIVNIEEIQNLILAFAAGDFSKRLAFSDKKDERDSIINGINMLGEELEQTTISRDYFSNIYNAVSDLLIVTDYNGIITDVNETSINKIKLPVEALINRDAKTLISDSALDLKKIFNKEIKYFHFDTVLTNAIGTQLNLSCSISKIFNRNDKHQGYLIIAKDVTAEKNKEQQLLNIIVSTQEKERKRLAYDLHDSLGQELNAIKMYLNTLTYLKHSENNNKIFEDCKAMLDESIETLRNLSFDLLPKSLEKGDVIFALKELISKLKGICKVKLTCKDETIVLDKDTQILIYRICQEFISNSMKHSDATKINIVIEKNIRKVAFILTDNGKGFNIGEVQFGNGLYNMKTRLKSIEAIYNFTSEINKGTYLNFELKNGNK